MTSSDEDWRRVLRETREAIAAGNLSPSEETWARWIATARGLPEDRIGPSTELVYYVRFSDRIKIGTTRNLRHRLSEVPHDELLAVEKGGRALERERHAQFAGDRVHREWFNPSPALLAHIRNLGEQS